MAIAPSEGVIAARQEDPASPAARQPGTGPGLHESSQIVMAA
jgi:hypothetical protein